MKEKFLLIWRDPVLSKVISIGIIGLGTLIYNWLTSKVERTDFESVFLNFWTQTIELWVLLIVILFFVFILYIRIYFKGNKQKNFKYDPETLKVDRALFEKIRNELLTQEMMISPRNNVFSSNSFPDKLLYNIIDILHESKKSDFEFFNPQLERLKLELINEINQFESIIFGKIFSAGIERLGIPHEWDHEKFYKASNEIGSQEKIICEKYDEFIKNGRRILKI